SPGELRTRPRRANVTYNARQTDTHSRTPNRRGGPTAPMALRILAGGLQGAVSDAAISCARARAISVPVQPRAVRVGTGETRRRRPTSPGREGLPSSTSSVTCDVFSSLGPTLAFYAGSAAAKRERRRPPCSLP